MKKLLLIMAAWLLPVSANAQMRLDFDADAYYDPPAAAASASPERPSETATSIATARAVRRGEQTVRLANGAGPGAGDRTALATAPNPY